VNVRGLLNEVEGRCFGVFDFLLAQVLEPVEIRAVNTHIVVDKRDDVLCRIQMLMAVLGSAVAMKGKRH